MEYYDERVCLRVGRGLWLSSGIRVLCEEVYVFLDSRRVFGTLPRIDKRLSNVEEIFVGAMKARTTCNASANHIDPWSRCPATLLAADCVVWISTSLFGLGSRPE